MNDDDYSVKSEDEFYEDFSGNELSDEEVEKILQLARQTSDI